ncbi:MAG: hypothetical protein DCC43_02250 [Candidatus Brocadia sp.]|nr:hypothetical protein [Candidatus Brocadia fulgida]MCC6325177.1 hypothetical protein [Candidatus Brocadia sp.]MDG5996060.1 hypothetical protein [Candidatus Brocadia sp.]RIK02724.1 MAG: hypothetical protein DCC43_02250 [Candidatus Brocadia sp.]
MSFPHISEDLKSVSVRIGGMCFTAEAVLRLCIDGFIGHKAELIGGAQERTVSLNEEGNQLGKLLRDKATERTGNKEQIKYLLATLSSVRLALNGLDSLSRHVKFKIDEKIILSDKGFDEIRYLFHASLDILKSAGDTIANRKESFMKYVMDKCANLEILARQYAERHEERLITGICLPDASPVYVCIVDSVLTVVWHIKNAVTRLFGKW